MGSLFSSPSTPSAPSVKFEAPSTSVNPTTATSSVDQTQTPETEDAVRDVIRRSSRGRSSTIQTSFRGVLGDANSLAPQRKTLLGE